MKRLQIIFLTFSVLFFFYNIILYVIGSYEIDYFDGALKLLSKIYISKGLTPFRDFSVVYPPGMFLIFGKIFPFRSLIQINILTSIGYILLYIYSLILLRSFSKKEKSIFFALSIMSLYYSIIIRLFAHSDAYSLYLFTLAVLVYLKSIESKTNALLIINILIYFIGIWFRWDWLLFILLLEVFIPFIIYIVFRRLFVKPEKHIKRNIFITTMSSLFGYITGALLLGQYLNSTGGLQKAYTFLVKIPLFLTSSYRNLPLPIPKHPLKPEMIIYLSALLLFYIIYKSTKYVLISIKNKGVKLSEFVFLFISLSSTIIFIIYALGRSDWPHFTPLWFYLGIVTLILNLKLKIFGNIMYILLILSFFPLSGWYIKATKAYLPRYNHAQNILNQNLKDCKNLVNNTYAKSIFVGRTQYNKFLWNNEALYLIRTDIPPATSFITEEPGVHNSCSYGEDIKIELLDSAKPMLAILNKNEQDGENKLTKNMTSCGHIESFLNENNYEILGNCKSYDFDFEVRLYK